MKKPPSENNKLTGYAAFLRGINVGGNNLIKMEDLKKLFESLGFKNVKTLLASGNVKFEAEKEKPSVLAGIIEEKLEKTYGGNISVTIRSIDDIKKIVDAEPFKKITVTPQTRLYVTFLPEKAKSSLKIPYSSQDNNFNIMQTTGNELFSVLTLSQDTNTINLMNILDKEFGKKVTTRNWNTIEKLLKK